jgi:hypothetical protein
VSRGQSRAASREPSAGRPPSTGSASTIVASNAAAVVVTASGEVLNRNGSVDAATAVMTRNRSARRVVPGSGSVVARASASISGGASNGSTCSRPVHNRSATASKPLVRARSAASCPR